MAKQSNLIFIRGLPGSGKTRLAKTLAKELGGSKTVLLDPDSIDQTSQEYLAHVEQQTKDGVDPKLHLYRFSRALAFQAIEDNKLIIWNQPFNDLTVFNKVTRRFYDFAKGQDIDLKILVVEVAIDPPLALSRIKRRKTRGGHGPSEEKFASFVKNYQSFSDQGYDVLVVDGAADTSKAAQQVITKLGQLL